MLSINLTGLPAILTSLIISALFAWYSLPRIIKVDSVRHLTDNPGPRKVHKTDIPTLGGAGIFAGFSAGFLLIFNGSIKGAAYIYASLIFLLFIGIMDDLINLKANRKLSAEIFAAIVIACFTNVHFTNFHGFLGIYEIPLWLSFITTVFIFIVVINALNLIDGIDGLAASTGIIASSALGLWFWHAGNDGYAIMAASLTGALVVFFFFNISKGSHKIFMGDTGSLVIGFILSVLTIRFNELNAGQDAINSLNSAPAISIAILIVPLFDTLRVFTLRIMNHQSPFRADKRHIHHLMLEAGYTHIQATLIIAAVHISIIIAAFLLDSIGIIQLCVVLLLGCLGLTEIVKMQVRRNINQYKLSLSKVNDDDDEKEISMINVEHVLRKKSI